MKSLSLPTLNLPIGRIVLLVGVIALTAMPSRATAEYCLFGRELFKNGSLYRDHAVKIHAFTKVFDMAKRSMATFSDINRQFEMMLEEFVDAGATSDEFTALSVYMVENKLRYMGGGMYAMYPIPITEQVADAFEAIARISKKVDLSQEQINIIGRAMETRGDAAAWETGRIDLKGALLAHFGKGQLQYDAKYTTVVNALDRARLEYKYMERYITDGRFAGRPQSEAFLRSYRGQWTAEEFTSIAKQILSDAFRDGYRLGGKDLYDANAQKMLEIVRRESLNYDLTAAQVLSIKKTAGMKKSDQFMDRELAPRNSLAGWYKIIRKPFGKNQL
jgi:hypothetical protein